MEKRVLKAWRDVQEDIVKLIKKNTPALDFSDLGAPEAVESFRKAAAAFTKEATRSAASARNILVREGIYTEFGELHKNYRS